MVKVGSGFDFLMNVLSMTTLGEAMCDRITFEPKIMGGRACIRGMRIPVSVIVGQVAHLLKKSWMITLTWN
jgi:uncharacterized protein (DUF433 family)